MKRAALVCILFGFLFAAGCKTHRVVKQRQNYSYEWDAGLTGMRSAGYFYTDSLIRQWQRRLTGRILFWSPPDSSGRQYIQAEIDLQTQETSETDRYISGVATDSIRTTATAQETGIIESVSHQESLHDSRPVSRTAIIVFCILGLMAWFYYRKKP